MKMEHIYKHRTIPEKCNDNFTNNAKKVLKNMGEANYRFQDYFTGFPILGGGGGMAGTSFILQFFFEPPPPPPIKTNYPHEGAPSLKNEAPPI